MSMFPAGFLVVVVPLIIVVIGVWGAVRYFRQREETVKSAVKSGDVESLRYHVPTGQDPAPIIAALRMQGYEAVPATSGVTQDLLIVSNGGHIDRAEVRRVIAHDADLNTQGDPAPARTVRFADE
jgi:hypothetical protein